MNNHRIKVAHIRSLFDAIAIFYFGLLRIDSHNNVFIGSKFIGKIEVNGVHDNNNLIYSWQILQKVIDELGDEKRQALIYLRENSNKILPNGSHRILNLLIEREL